MSLWVGEVELDLSGARRRSGASLVDTVGLGGDGSRVVSVRGHCAVGQISAEDHGCGVVWAHLGQG